MSQEVGSWAVILGLGIFFGGPESGFWDVLEVISEGLRISEFTEMWVLGCAGILCSREFFGLMTGPRIQVEQQFECQWKSNTVVK